MQAGIVQLPVSAPCVAAVQACQAALDERSHGPQLAVHTQPSPPRLAVGGAEWP